MKTREKSFISFITEGLVGHVFMYKMEKYNLGQKYLFWNYHTGRIGSTKSSVGSTFSSRIVLYLALSIFPSTIISWLSLLKKKI